MISMITALVQNVVGGSAQGPNGPQNPVPGGTDNMLEMLQTLSNQLGMPFGGVTLGTTGNAFSPLQNPAFGQPTNGSFAFACSGSSGQPQAPRGGGQEKPKDAPKPGGLAGSPLGGILNGVTSVAKNVLSGGKVPIGASVMVGVLQGIVGAACTDPQQRANIEACLKQVQDGKPLKECLGQLSECDKTKLADTIGSCGFEIPECLNEFASNPESSGNSARPDCALKTVEESEAGRYGSTLAGILTSPLELLRGGGLGI